MKLVRSHALRDDASPPPDPDMIDNAGQQQVSYSGNTLQVSPTPQVCMTNHIAGVNNTRDNFQFLKTGNAMFYFCYCKLLWVEYVIFLREV